MKKNILILILVSLVSGCMIPLTEGGSDVQILTPEQKKDLVCSRVGIVSGFNTLSATTGTEKENAIVKALNKAAKLGANAISIIGENTSIQGSSISAEALNCEIP